VRINLELPAALEAPLFATIADDGKPVRHRALHGGRGSSKSHGFGRRLLVRGFEKPERILCAREIQSSIGMSVKALLDDLIPQLGFGPTNGDGFYLSQRYSISARNGTTVDFAGLRSNIDSIKSAEGFTIAYVSEARAVSQNSLNVLGPTIRAPGSELWWDWNPLLPTDPIDVMFRGENGPPPGSIVRQINYLDNPWFGEPLKSDMEYDRARDPEKYQHIWLGGYQRSSEARVFRNWRIEECEPAPGSVFRLGADFGFSIDPSCAVRCWIEGRNLYVDHEAYRIGCEVDNLPDLFMSIPEAEKWPMVADTSRPETISYLRKHGFPKIAAAIKGARSVEEGVAFLQSYDIIVHPRCQHVIDELTLYSYKTDPLTGLVLPVLADKDNHLIDSLRYATEGARRALAARPAAVSVAIPSMVTGMNRGRG
jgi:phage terminase large subunit